MSGTPISPSVIQEIMKEKGGKKSMRSVARKFGVDPMTVKKYWAKSDESKPSTSDGLKPSTADVSKPITIDVDPSNPMVRSDALKFIQRKKAGFTTDQLASRLQTTKERAKQIIQHLSHHDGYNIMAKGDENWQLVSELPSLKPLKLKRLLGKQYSFGLLGDTQLCHETERLDVLEAAYDEFARRKITDVFHTGNMIDGEFKYNMYEINRHGAHNQAQYVADVYPQRSGITTHFITGDCHEGWYQDKTGIKIGWYIQQVCEEAGRKDMIHIGHVERDVILKQKIGDTRIRIMHPGGGAAYALSYPGQKMVESFQGGEKPHVLLLGHYHKFDINYAREVVTVLTGCVADQSKFMRKHKLAAHVGFIVMTIGARVDGTIGRSNVEWYPFYDRNYHQKLNSYVLEKSK